MARQQEHNLQVNIIALLRWNGIFCFAVPNGGRRDAITGARLKAEGVLAGVADIIVLLPNGETVFIELKTKTGTQQSSQKAFEEKVKSLGFTYLIWRDLEDAQEFARGLKKMEINNVK